MNLELLRISNFCRLRYGPVQLAFEHATDRWEHQLCLDGGIDPRRYLWTALQGEAADIPDNPVFQDLHVHDVDTNCREIQLLGQSGKSLYSGAVRFDAAAGVIDFDLAARLHRADQISGVMSSYEFNGNRASICESQTAEGESILLTGAELPLRIEPVQSSAGPRVDCRIEPSGEPDSVARLAVGCFDLTQLEYRKGSELVRWRYRIWFGSNA